MSNKYRSYCFVWESSGHKLVDIISKTCNVGIISKSCRCYITFIYLSLANQIACSICYNCDLNIGRSEIASHWRSWLWGYAYVASLVLGKNLLLQLESWEIWPGDEAIANGLNPRATSSSECNALAIYHRVILEFQYHDQYMWAHSTLLNYCAYAGHTYLRWLVHA